MRKELKAKIPLLELSFVKMPTALMSNMSYRTTPSRWGARHIKQAKSNWKSCFLMRRRWKNCYECKKEYSVMRLTSSSFFHFAKDFDTINAIFGGWWDSVIRTAPERSPKSRCFTYQPHWLHFLVYLTRMSENNVPFWTYFNSRPKVFSKNDLVSGIHILYNQNGW